MENSQLLPKTNYSKNKLISENKLKKRISKNLIILRISNVIGDKSKIKKIHNTFIDIFYQNIKKGFIFDNKKDFKDAIIKRLNGPGDLLRNKINFDQIDYSKDKTINRQLKKNS